MPADVADTIAVDRNIAKKGAPAGPIDDERGPNDRVVIRRGLRRRNAVGSVDLRGVAARIEASRGEQQAECRDREWERGSLKIGCRAHPHASRMRGKLLPAAIRIGARPSMMRRNSAVSGLDGSPA